MTYYNIKLLLKLCISVQTSGRNPCTGYQPSKFSATQDNTTQEDEEKHPCLERNSNRNPSTQAAQDPCPRQLDLWGQSQKMKANVLECNRSSPSTRTYEYIVFLEHFCLYFNNKRNVLQCDQFTTSTYVYIVLLPHFLLCF